MSAIKLAPHIYQHIYDTLWKKVNCIVIYPVNTSTFTVALCVCIHCCVLAGT